MKRQLGNPVAWLLGLLATVIAVAGALWFDRNFEQQTREFPSGYSAAAMRNPFLAAERFLTEVGIATESVAGRNLLRELPPPTDMLVLNGLGPLNAERRRQLHAWLTAGGAVLVEARQVLAPDERPRTDNFLANQGVALRSIDAADERAEVIAEISMDGYPKAIRVGFVPEFFLQDLSGDSIGSVSADGRARLLQYRIGDGLLSVTSDNVFLTNGDIGNHDHALFLALMSAQAGKVWLLHDQSMPGLTTLLWQAAPQVVIAAALLSAGLLWYLGGRIGPLLPNPPRDRRDLLDHMEAAADFLWRHGRGSLQLAATRKRVEQAWMRRHPLLREMDSSERAGWIGEQTGLVQAEVQQALYSRPRDDDDLVRQTGLLQRIWNAL